MFPQHYQPAPRKTLLLLFSFGPSTPHHEVQKWSILPTSPLYPTYSSDFNKIS
jgi:hypothetical protein